MQKIFQFYADPGHGWVKVPFSVLYKLGIQDKITNYSYQRGSNAYLEEDCDLSTFFNAYRQATGIDPILKGKTSNRTSKIRNYFRYSI